MIFALQLKIMIASLRKNSARALSALVCVGLGIASMMITLALSTGAEREMQAISDKVGKNIFVIKAASVQSRPGRTQGWFKSTKLRAADAEVIRDQVDGVHRVVPVTEASLKVKLNSKDFTTNVKGVGHEYFEVRNFQVESGRAFDDFEDEGLQRVAVVGAFVAQKVNNGQDMVGETIWLAGVPFEVIGQLKAKGVSSDGTNEDDQILVPVGTAMRRLFNVDYLSSLLVQMRSQTQLAGAQGRVEALLRGTHGLDEDVKDDFEILSLVKSNEIRKLSAQFLRGISQLFAAITLAIGGAGLFAVTYLNVKDRTGEIGLRMAIGARRRDIARLFIFEASLLSVLGGIAGIATGGAGIALLKFATDWAMSVSAFDLLLPFAVSLTMGIVFGVMPALKASRLMPVEALRNP